MAAVIGLGGVKWCMRHGCGEIKGNGWLLLGPVFKAARLRGLKCAIGSSKNESDEVFEKRNNGVMLQIAPLQCNGLC